MVSEHEATYDSMYKHVMARVGTYSSCRRKWHCSARHLGSMVCEQRSHTKNQPDPTTVAFRSYLPFQNWKEETNYNDE